MLYVLVLILAAIALCGAISLISATTRKQVQEMQVLKDRKKREQGEQELADEARRQEGVARSERWENLCRYDPKIRAASEKLSEYGNPALNELRHAYESLGNPDNLDSIADQIAEDFRSGKLPHQDTAATGRESAYRSMIIRHEPDGRHVVDGKTFGSLRDAQDYVDMIKW